METRIDFARKRDMGELLSAAFSFIRIQFRGYFGALLVIGGPAYLISMILQTMYQIKILKSAGEYGDDPFGILRSVFGWEFAAALVFGIVAAALLVSASMAYIKLYIRGNHNPTVAEVWPIASERIGTIILASVVVVVALILGFVLLVIPGIWLAVSLSVFFAVLLLEDGEITDAFSRSIKLVNTQWWATFGLLIVTFIILIIFSAAITLPFTIAGLFLTVTKDADGLGWFTIISNTISQIASFLISGFFYVLMAFLYFSLREKREGVSLETRVQDLGNNTSTHTAEEEY